MTDDERWLNPDPATELERLRKTVNVMREEQFDSRWRTAGAITIASGLVMMAVSTGLGWDDADDLFAVIDTTDEAGIVPLISYLVLLPAVAWFLVDRGSPVWLRSTAVVGAIVAVGWALLYAAEHVNRGSGYEGTGPWIFGLGLVSVCSGLAIHRGR